MNWIPFAIAVIVFVMSCVGLGYLAGFLVRRRGWPGWVLGLMVFAIACIWPVMAVGFVLYTGGRYAAQHPGEVNDAPAMVLMGVIQVSPYIFFFGLSFTVVGLCIARRGDSHRALG
jgi:hypothetical protein